MMHFSPGFRSKFTDPMIRVLTASVSSAQSQNQRIAYIEHKIEIVRGD